MQRQISNALQLSGLVVVFALAGCVVHAGPGGHRPGHGPGVGPGASPVAADEPPDPPQPAAALPAGVAKGVPPKMEPGAPVAYWIWQDPGGMWHLRTTTAQKPHTFAGKIVAAHGPMADVVPTKLELRDRVRQGPKGAHFQFETNGHMDGLDFRPANGGCVRFALRVDGGSHPKRIFIGAGAAEPPHAHFTLCP